MAGLTDKQIKAALTEIKKSGGRKEQSDAQRSPGLSLRISGHSTAWTLTYKMRGDGKRKRLTIGRYPAISIKDARELAEGYRRKVANGIDPVAEAREKVVEVQAEIAAEKARITFDTMLNKFLEAKSKLRWAKQYCGILERAVLKPTNPEVKRLKLASMAAEDITRANIKAIVNAKRDEGYETQALRTYEVLRTAFNWAVDNELVPVSPVHKKDRPSSPEAGDRVLTVSEILRLWQALGTQTANHSFRDILRLQLLLGQRSGEVAGMARSEIKDGGMAWEIPASRSKNGRKHRVPLPPLARSIISDARERSQSAKYIFPTEARLHNKKGIPSRTLVPITSDVVANFVCKIRDELKFTDADGNDARFTAHDLRRTVATLLEEMGTPRPIIAHLLNHVSETKSGVTAKHYTKGDLEPEVRLALTQWQKAVETILDGGDPLAHRKADIHAMEAEILGAKKQPRLRVVAGGVA